MSLRATCPTPSRTEPRLVLSQRRGGGALAHPALVAHLSSNREAEFLRQLAFLIPKKRGSNGYGDMCLTREA